MKDWVAWHRDYADASSPLARRLRVVRSRLAEVMSDPGTRPRRVLDLCAGDGRDLLPVLASLRPEQRPDAVLVELDPALARRAADDAAAAGLGGSVTVIQGDAGRPDTYAHALPVDLLMLCGIFGNISEGDIESTIAAAGAMLTRRGVVIWTRGAFAPGTDLRPAVRGWFRAAGLAEVSWDGEPDEFGVGVNRRTDQVRPQPVPPRLFTFRR